MVEKKVKSLIDGEISTYLETHFVVVGEVLVIQFKNKDTFASYIQAGVLVEAEVDEPIGKTIPIIPAEVDESGLPFVGEDAEVLDEAKEFQFEPATRKVEEILFNKVKDENKSGISRAQL